MNSVGPAIQLEHVRKSFRTGPEPEQVALDGVDLAIETGETVCLVGASGSGKTTTLRMMNRLESPSSGTVRVDGQDLASADPVALRRSMGYVIQAAGLFPHLTVEANVGLLCRLEGWEASRRRERVAELLELVQLSPAEYAPRFPSQLSGGEAQRVGVARALALDPRIVLMDEPFGALDPVTRGALQREFQGLRARLDKTLVVVTHDMAEAFLLADRIVFLSGGRVVQVGEPDQFRNRPATPEVERFVASQAEALSR